MYLLRCLIRNISMNFSCQLKNTYIYVAISEVFFADELLDWVKSLCLKQIYTVSEIQNCLCFIGKLWLYYSRYVSKSRFTCETWLSWSWCKMLKISTFIYFLHAKLCIYSVDIIHKMCRRQSIICRKTIISCSMLGLPLT